MVPKTWAPFFKSSLAWCARIGAIVSFSFLGLFVVAHLHEGGPQPTATEWAGLAFFPVGVMVGLLIGLIRPTIGGSLTVFSVVAFYVWNWSVSGGLPKGPYFILLSLPGVLQLLQGASTARKKGDLQ